MIIINFSHPLNSAQLSKIVELTGEPNDQVLEILAQFDHEQSFIPQAQALVNKVRLTAEEWQTLPLVIVLPAYAPGTAAVLADIHGRMGHFPAIVRLKPVNTERLTTYEVAEIINLDALRDAARKLRTSELSSLSG